MGRYSRRAEGPRKLLTEQQGWERLREMALFEAVQLFLGSERPSDRIGARRCYLALADLFASLDELFLDVESAYLESLGSAAEPHDRARRGFIRLRRAESKRAAAEFLDPGPEGFGFLWTLGRAGIAAQEGRGDEARAILAAAPPPPDDEALALAQVCSYLWRIRCQWEPKGAYGRALSAFQQGDLATGVMALQMLDFAADTMGADPHLFLYALFRRTFAGLVLSVAGDDAASEEAFLAAQAHEHLGGYAEAAELFRRVDRGAGSGSDAAWIFSPYHGRDEAIQVAGVRLGAALYRAGQQADGLETWRRMFAAGDLNALAIATLAAFQLELGASGPLAAPNEAVATSLAAVLEAPTGFGALEETELLASLYPVRVAAVSRLAARVQRRTGSARTAAQLMGHAHRKSSGYRSDFVNPPAFLAELAGVRTDVGEYASAVAVMFELAREYPSARLAYESLKRLYASRTGGDAPPR
jgi:hypothetical protein